MIVASNKVTKMPQCKNRVKQVTHNNMIDIYSMENLYTCDFILIRLPLKQQAVPLSTKTLREFYKSRQMLLPITRMVRTTFSSTYQSGQTPSCSASATRCYIKIDLYLKKEVSLEWDTTYNSAKHVCNAWLKILHI